MQQHVSRAGTGAHGLLLTWRKISLTDVPVGASVSFRVNDQNWCDQNPTGAVLRNVFANDVQLAQNTLTPGSGQEPGFAFTVDAAGRVRQ